MESELPNNIIERYIENLTILKNRLDLYEQDPLSVPPDLLNPIFITEQIIAIKKSNLSPQDHLTVLDKMEEWYESRGGKFPNVDWLANQRKNWTSKLE